MIKLLLFLSLLKLFLSIVSAKYNCTGCDQNSKTCTGTCNAENVATITPCYGNDICHVNALFNHFIVCLMQFTNNLL